MATFTLVNGAASLTVTTDDTDDCETLDQVFDLYRESINIPEGASIAINGDAVNPEDVSVDDIEDGAEVVATKTTGSKG